MDLIDLIAWILLAVFFLIVILVRCMTSLWSRQQAAREALDRERFGRWECPHCHQPYGAQVQFARGARSKRGHEAGFSIEGKLFMQDVILVCPQCQWLACYDAQGYSPPSMQGLFSLESAESE